MLAQQGVSLVDAIRLLSSRFFGIMHQAQVGIRPGTRFHSERPLVTFPAQMDPRVTGFSLLFLDGPRHYCLHLTNEPAVTGVPHAQA